MKCEPQFDSKNYKDFIDLLYFCGEEEKGGVGFGREMEKKGGGEGMGVYANEM